MKVFSEKMKKLVSRAGNQLTYCKWIWCCKYHEKQLFWKLMLSFSLSVQICILIPVVIFKRRGGGQKCKRRCSTRIFFLLAFLTRTGAICPVPVFLSQVTCHGRPVPDVMSGMSCTGCPSTALSWLSYPGCLVLDVVVLLSCPAVLCCPVKAFLLKLSCNVMLKIV